MQKNEDGNCNEIVIQTGDINGCFGDVSSSDIFALL